MGDAWDFDYMPLSEAQTGRGPNGKPRNFKAMGSEKFAKVYYLVVVAERNDPQCVALLQNERDRRGLVDPGNGKLQAKPKDDVELILDALADF
jgi:hypothetical protein